MILKRDQLFRVVCSILTPTTSFQLKLYISRKEIIAFPLGKVAGERLTDEVFCA